MRRAALALTLLGFGSASAGATELEYTFVALSSDGAVRMHDPERATTRFTPASTFKIANMLIALETGVAKDAEFLLPWDGQRPTDPDAFWPRKWSRDHTLRSAFHDSVLWYFREIARRVGREAYTELLGAERFDYGNRDVSGPVDLFWLGGSLRISAREQVEFLRRFYEGELGLSEHTTAQAKDVMVRETNDRYRLSGKTGTAQIADGLLCWFVGYVETGDDVHYFALNMDCPDMRSCHPSMRQDRTLAKLREWGMLPPEADDGLLPGSDRLPSPP